MTTKSAQLQRETVMSSPASKIRPVLVIGMSHITALQRATGEASDWLRFVPLGRTDQAWKDRRTGGFAADFLRQFDQDIDIVAMLAGNFHNVFGLFEHPIKLNVWDRTEDRPVSNSPDRCFVPMALLEALFRERLQGRVFRGLESLRCYFTGRKIYVLPPPPIESDEHIRSHPGVFKDRLQLGIAPREARMVYYRLETDLVRDFCERIGFRVIDPPAEALTPDGLLSSDFAAQDPTHGNARYGALVTKQIERELAL